jgi:hypothetical protein
MRNSAQRGPALLTACCAVLFANGAYAPESAAAKGRVQDGPSGQRLTEKYRELHAANRGPGISFHAYYVRNVASGQEREQ